MGPGPAVPGASRCAQSPEPAPGCQWPLRPPPRRSVVRFGHRPRPRRRRRGSARL